MFEQLGSIHPLLPPGVDLLALLAGAVIINMIVKWVFCPHRACIRGTIEHHLG